MSKSLSGCPPEIKINWDWVAEHLPDKETKVQTGVIDLADLVWLQAVSSLRKISVAALSASLLRAQVRRWRDDWGHSILIKAKAAGVPFETMLLRLAKGDEKFNLRPPETSLEEQAIALLEKAGYTVTPPSDS